MNDYHQMAQEIMDEESAGGEAVDTAGTVVEEGVDGTDNPRQGSIERFYSLINSEDDNVYEVLKAEMPVLLEVEDMDSLIPLIAPEELDRVSDIIEQEEGYE
jgi:hypothetical protein